jgi:hypothetical protein
MEIASLDILSGSIETAGPVFPHEEMNFADEFCLAKAWWIVARNRDW